MTFQPDLAGFARLPSAASFPPEMQGEWVDPETGVSALTIGGRNVTLDVPMPVHELFVREEGAHMAVLNTLADTSGLDPDWAERTVYMFHLDDAGALSITGCCDYWTLVRPEAVDPAEVRPPSSPYQPLAPDEPFPELLQGHWHGAWHGQEVVIGPRDVTIDGERVHYLAAKLIKVIPSPDAPLCSLVLDLHAADVAARFGGDAMSILNFMVFRNGEMQGAGAGLRDGMFTTQSA